MQDNQLTWKYRFARMKRHYGFSYEKMANLIGVKADSIRAFASLSDERFPNAWKMSVVIFEIEQGILNVDEALLPMNENPYL